MRHSHTPHTRLAWLIASVLILLPIVCVGLLYLHHRTARRPVTHSNERQDIPSPMARWPWPDAKVDRPHKGVTHWIDRSSSDGTVLDLFDFDFGANPRLRLELYDQDEDDRVPFDNQAEIWERAVGQVTRHLNDIGRGKVVAAWNGLFFTGDDGIASHVAPVVLNGKPRYNVGLVRWAVGVKYVGNLPTFKVVRLPPVRSLAGEYDYAAEGTSCLVLDGKPLRMKPFPKPDENPFPPSEPPGPGDSGFVRKVDHIRTSRTSMAWSKDNRHLYLLIVKEPDSEPASIMALRHRTASTGGWTVADEQRFWLQFGAWCAVNLDGGDVTQLAAVRSDGRYEIIPARCGSDSMRLTVPPDCAGAPPGGSLMYFFIRDTTFGKR